MKNTNTSVAKTTYSEELISYQISNVNSLSLPTNFSSFPNNVKEICESKVNVICSVPALPVSG